MTVLSTLLLARYRSWRDQARSRISPKQTKKGLFNVFNIQMTKNRSSAEKKNIQPEWPRSWVEHRQFSALLAMPELPKTVDGPTPRFQSIIILSSPPDANVVPLNDHRTQFTHAKWLSNWHNFFVTLGEFSAFSSITGNKFQITTWPASLPCPPVANFVPSGWTSMENIGLPAHKTKVVYLFAFSTEKRVNNSFFCRHWQFAGVVCANKPSDYNIYSPSWLTNFGLTSRMAN